VGGWWGGGGGGWGWACAVGGWFCFGGGFGGGGCGLGGRTSFREKCKAPWLASSRNPALAGKLSTTPLPVELRRSFTIWMFCSQEVCFSFSPPLNFPFPLRGRQTWGLVIDFCTRDNYPRWPPGHRNKFGGALGPGAFVGSSTSDPGTTC